MDREDKRKENKKKRCKVKEALKKAKVDSLQDERDRKTKFYKIAAGAGGSRLSIIDVEGDSYLSLTNVIDSVAADGTSVEENMTRLESLNVDVVYLAPWAPRYDLSFLLYIF